MTPRRRVMSGGAIVVAGQAGAQLFGFVRNVIIARVLSPTDVGIAAIFATTMSFLDMVSDLNAGMLLIQSEGGDDPEFQATIHSLALVRGILISIVLLVLAGPAAWLFKIGYAR